MSSAAAPSRCWTARRSSRPPWTRCGAERPASVATAACGSPALAVVAPWWWPRSIVATRGSSPASLHTVGPPPTGSGPTTDHHGRSRPLESAPHLPPKLAFADTANGWMAAGGSCSSGSCADPIMRHTTDSGRTWSRWASVPDTRAVSLDPQTRRDLGGLVILDFADPRDGWYGQGGQLWSTHDGGHTWQRVVVAGYGGGHDLDRREHVGPRGPMPDRVDLHRGRGHAVVPDGAADHRLRSRPVERGPARPPELGRRRLVGGDGSVWILTAGPPVPLGHRQLRRLRPDRDAVCRPGRDGSGAGAADRGGSHRGAVHRGGGRWRRQHHGQGGGRVVGRGEQLAPVRHRPLHRLGRLGHRRLGGGGVRGHRRPDAVAIHRRRLVTGVPGRRPPAGWTRCWW